MIARHYLTSQVIALPLGDRKCTFTFWIANGNTTLAYPGTLALFRKFFLYSVVRRIWKKWTTQITFGTTSSVALSIQDVNLNPGISENDCPWMI
jgi:hypothetical protein